MRRTTRTCGTAVLAGMVLASSACGGAADAAGEQDAADVREVTLQSDDSTSRVGPVCVEDVPEDLTTCPAATQNLGTVELDTTRKATVRLPASVSEGGYRLRINGSPLPGLEGVLNDKAQPFRVPQSVVDAPGETVVTVEALMTTSHPIAVWRFLLSDPAGPPA